MIPHDFNQSSVPNKNLETESAGCPNKLHPAPTRDTDINPRALFTIQKWSQLKSYRWSLSGTADDCARTRLDSTRLEANRLCVPAERNFGPLATLTNPAWSPPQFSWLLPCVLLFGASSSSNAPAKRWEAALEHQELPCLQHDPANWTYLSKRWPRPVTQGNY